MRPYRTLFVITLLLFGQPVYAENSAQALVEQTSKTMLDTISAKRASITQQPESLYQLVDAILLPHIDFQYMSQLVLGKHWRRASEQQRTEFVQQFRNLLIRTYATALFEYSGQKIEFLPARAEANATDVTVRSVIHPQAGPVIPVNYGMYLKEGNWKLYDIMIDGISLVSNYRSSFGSQISRENDGLNALISKLASHNQTVKN